MSAGVTTAGVAVLAPKDSPGARAWLDAKGFLEQIAGTGDEFSRADVQIFLAALLLKERRRLASLAMTVSREWASNHKKTCNDCERTALEMGADLEEMILKGGVR